MAQWQREIAQQYFKQIHTMQRMYNKIVTGDDGRLKKLTLLHSNDMHGDFLADDIDSNLVGGVSLLSGYVHKVRREQDNVIYAIAGDMLRGSIIDSEYKGLSTIQIMNMLEPDVATIGNHEVDYGVAHLLFLEKCANFPIISANLRISTNRERLFEPFRLIEVGGIKVLFIGATTEVVLGQCKSDGFIGSFVTVGDPVEEIGRICNAYNGLKPDLTVLLTHIGFEEDKKLAEMLDPAWGIDIIIGGHSHTLLEEPAVVNGIPIVQVGTGTDQIGRFDITVDTKRSCIESYTWQAVPIDADHCPLDEALEKLILDCKETTDQKYNQVITRLDRQLTHPTRIRETELGDLFADVLRDALGVDVLLVGSGSIRGFELGPVVTKGDLSVCFPYDGKMYAVYMTGAQLKHALRYMVRDDVLAGNHSEFFQLSHGLEVEYDQATHSFVRFDYEGAPVDDERVFSVGLQGYYFDNIEYSFDLTAEQLRENRPEHVLATSSTEVIEEVLATGEYRDATGEGRVVLHIG